MTIQMEDRAVLAQSSIRRTAGGYLAAQARVARTGIQIYAGREVGRSDLEKVRVYRPESEVFRRDAMTSLAHRPITSDHPPVPVTADNWKKYAIGHVGDEVVRDGHFVRVPMLVMDADSIRRIENDGTRELSVGYVCDIAWEAGISPTGEEYDAIQRNIKVNHIAVVKSARGGSDLRIGDAEGHSCPECGAKWSGPSKKCPECGYVVKDSAADAVAADRMRHDGDNEGDERMKTIVVDGISLEMPETAAAVVDKVIKTLADQLKGASDSKSSADAQVATLTTQLAAKDAEIVTLKKQVDDSQISPQKLDELVKSRAAVVDKAKKLLGDKLIIDGKSEHEIRKQVVDSVVGDAAKGWDENQIAASFVAIAADKKTDDGVRDISRGFAGSHQVLGDERTKAYADRDKTLEDAWKPGASH